MRATGPYLNGLLRGLAVGLLCYLGTTPGCAIGRPPNPGPPTPPPVDPSPICKPGETCGCWHRPPGSDWVKLPDCKPDPGPEPPDPASICTLDTPDASLFKLDVRWNLAQTVAWVDATPKVNDRVFCPKYNSNPMSQVVCPLRPEGHPARVDCDMKHGLPVWFVKEGTDWKLTPSDDGDPFHVHVPAGTLVKACLKSDLSVCSDPLLARP